MPLSWSLLVYKIPPEPSASRVGIWRQLKRRGAHLLHDAIWVLPARPDTRAAFHRLATEIRAAGGAATVWEAQATDAAEEAELIAAFRRHAEFHYQEILTALTNADADIAKLVKRYHVIRAADYFQHPLAEEVHRALTERGG